MAFGRIEVRLAEFLLKQANADGSLATTPQAIAVESGSAREVVSRQLKAFERNGWVRLHRGNVEILEPAVLRSFIAA